MSEETDLEKLKWILINSYEKDNFPTELIVNVLRRIEKISQPDVSYLIYMGATMMMFGPEYDEEGLSILQRAADLDRDRIDALITLYFSTESKKEKRICAESILQRIDMLSSYLRSSIESGEEEALDDVIRRLDKSISWSASLEQILSGLRLIHLPEKRSINYAAELF